MSVSLRLCETPASKITGKIKRMTAALDIADLLLKKPDELSEEETLKVLIARAAVREPEVLIMDHPFTGEDLNERLKYLDVLEKMHQKLKLTMIVLSEDRYIAKNFPGRIVILNNGVIQQIGEASSVFAHPKNLFAASFLTLPQMSTLLGVIRLEGDDYFVELGEQRILVPGKEKLHRHIGKEVLVGIRPETVRLQKDGETYQYTGTAQRVENTVYGEQVTIDNGHFTITAPNDMHVFEGEKIGFTFLGESILLFDKGTERNIL
jgi:multiple sugar transport system ATP-binding protein